MARLEIAAGLRLWLGHLGPMMTRCASAGSQAKSNLRMSRRDDTMADATETAMSSSKDEPMCLSERM